MFGYHVPAPNEALLISGRKQRHSDGRQFKIVTGHGVFVFPILSRASKLTLAMQEAEVIEDCFTQQGLTLAVQAVIAFKVGDDHESIAAAARRFQGDQSQMPTLVGRIFSGHLRSIIGSMTVEAIIREQQTLGDAILDASKTEMGRIGLAVDSLQISSIDDKGSGYIKALAAPHQATVNQAAKVAQAAADQASARAQQESVRFQNEYARQTAVSQAQFQAEIDQAQQKASMAGPLAAAQAQQEVLLAQTELAHRNAELREQQLVAEVVKPAQAEAERVRVLAKADAERIRIQAEAAASHNRVALDRMLIDQLPLIVREAANGLQGANVNILNGATGLGEMAASLVGQGLTIFESIRGNLGQPDEDAPDEPDVPQLGN
jgi:flotillin